MTTGAQEVVVGRPGRAVGQLVRRHEGFQYSGLKPGAHKGLPSRNLTLIVSLDDPINITAIPGQQSPGSCRAFVGGLHVKPATVCHAGSGASISIELSPLASRAHFGIPAAALASGLPRRTVRR